MFGESYIIFSVGNIKQLQQWSFPSCYNKLWPIQDCGANNYLGFLDYGADSYVQLIGIIVSLSRIYWCPPFRKDSSMDQQQRTCRARVKTKPNQKLWPISVKPHCWNPPSHYGHMSVVV